MPVDPASVAIWAGWIGGITYVAHLARKKLKKRARSRPRKSSFRAKLIRRYGHRCMNCGHTKNVHAHHIKPFAKNGKDDPKNGILLCPNCHARADSGELTIKELKRCKAKAERRLRKK